MTDEKPIDDEEQDARLPDVPDEQGGDVKNDEPPKEE